MRRASPRVRGRRPMIVPLVTGHTRRHASYHESAEALLNGSALSTDVDTESGRRSPRPWSSTRTTWRSGRRGRPGPVASPRYRRGGTPKRGGGGAGPPPPPPPPPPEPGGGGRLPPPPPRGGGGGGGGGGRRVDPIVV